jgi:ABC-type nitrate/sulfonate/bicarbonate transport system substrate-binding protein
MGDKLRVRVIYRSRGIQLSLLAAMRAGKAWEEAGLDPGDDVPWVRDAADGDAMLEAGDVDFIFGSHVTPYVRFGEGVPFVYLGQTVNWSDDVLVTRAPVAGVGDVRGLRMAEKLSRHSHSRGNRLLFLQRAGVDESEVQWIDKGKRSSLEVLETGDADAAFMSPIDAADVGALGLHVHVPPPLPMVVGSTMTTLWSTVHERPEVCRRLLRAVRLGVRFFKNEPEQMADVFRHVVGPGLGIDDQTLLQRLYERNARLLEEDLYPRHEAVANAFALAVRQSPNLDERVKPHMLWDVHFLRELDDTTVSHAGADV